MNRAAANQRRARRLPPPALSNKRSPSERFGREPDVWHIAATSARNRVLTTSISPTSRAVIAASMSLEQRGGRGPACYTATRIRSCHVLRRVLRFAAVPASPRFLARNCAPDRSHILRDTDRTRVRLPAPPQKRSDIAEPVGQRRRVILPAPGRAGSVHWRVPTPDRATHPLGVATGFALELLKNSGE